MTAPRDSLIYMVRRITIASTRTPSFEHAMSLIDPVTCSGITSYQIKVVRTRIFSTESPDEARAVLDSARREMRRI